MLSAVVHGTVEGADGGAEPLTELELQMFFNLLIAAGSETTRNSIAVGAARADRASRRSGARCAPTARCCRRAVEEILRWASSTPYNRRTATRDVALRRRRPIRAGDKVTLWWASANRDEEVFADPFRFDVRRAPQPAPRLRPRRATSASARASRASRSASCSTRCSTASRAIALAGPVEWTRSNKHTGVRHMPVALRS